MDNGHWVISTPHADSPTGYVYLSLVDENAFICTKNISEATIFASYDRALDFRDDWNLGGLYTIEAMMPIIAKKWDSARLINDGTQPMPILLESEAKQLMDRFGPHATYRPTEEQCENPACWCRANIWIEDVDMPHGIPWEHWPATPTKKKSLYDRVLSFLRNFEYFS